MSVSHKTVKSDKQWCVYIVECADHTLYTGITNDLSKRISNHNAGKGAKYTRARLPVTLLWSTPAANKSEAAKLEAKIKKLKRVHKISLINGVSNEG